MAIRVALIAIPTATIVGLVVLLNSLDASPGIAVAALMVVAALSGATFGYFADRLPELPRARHSAHPLVPHHVD
jgi:hypothetical protein